VNIRRGSEGQASGCQFYERDSRAGEKVIRRTGKQKNIF
jgi:hypothetical protein